MPHFESICKKKNFSKPNIYFILLDAHSSPKVLQKYYNYDCKNFVNNLKKNGFFLTPNSYSHYPGTTLSIPSTLDMTLQKIQAKNWDIQCGLDSYIIPNNNAAFFLKKLGYRFINIPSNWGPTRKMLTPFKYYIPSDFYNALFCKLTDKTVVASALRWLYNYGKQKNIKNQLKALEKAVYIKGPKFVFAHILCPHQPYIFDKKGNLPSDISSHRQAYTNQVHFIDNQINKTINKILENSKNSPIIILQADHGQTYAFGNNDIQKLVKKSVIELQHNILSVFYLPNFPRKKLWNNISPVNNFRLIFNHYFGANFSYIEDKK
ncbi:MAG: sulfatase-like hydrolase/transferase [Candidatus Helarchaeota archaeon]